MQTRDAVSAYLDRLRTAGRRANTLRGYETDLRVLVECAAARDGALDQQAVDDYLAWPTARAAATQARRLSVLRGLLRSCDRMDLLPPAGERPQPSAPPPRRESPRDLRSDIESVLAAIPRQADRDQLFFGVLARLGLRPGEALALQVEDFEEKSASLHVTGWGGHRRRVFVDDKQTLLRLTNYVRFNAGPSGSLFTAQGRETPLRYQSVQHRWGQYCSTVGVVLRLSDLRRAHAADLLAGGVPEDVVRERLGQHTGSLGGVGLSFSIQDSDDELIAWHKRRETGSTSRGVINVTQGRAG